MTADTLELPAVRSARRRRRSGLAARLAACTAGAVAFATTVMLLTQAFPPARQQTQLHCAAYRSCACRWPDAPTHLNGNHLCVAQHQSTAPLWKAR